VSSPIVEFYAGKAPDSQGRFLKEILAWDDSRLEAVHDYIQWLFPLPERSAFNPDAPLLDSPTIEAFRESAALRESLAAAFRRMLAFYGFEYGETIRRSGNFEERAQVWLRSGNHNHLRITRILKSLRLLGLAEQAAAFLRELETLYRDRPRTISAETLCFWQAARTA
jgi:hypothetical protein